MAAHQLVRRVAGMVAHPRARAVAGMAAHQLARRVAGMAAHPRARAVAGTAAHQLVRRVAIHVEGVAMSHQSDQLVAHELRVVLAPPPQGVVGGIALHHAHESLSSVAASKDTQVEPQVEALLLLALLRTVEVVDGSSSFGGEWWRSTDRSRAAAWAMHLGQTGDLRSPSHALTVASALRSSIAPPAPLAAGAGSDATSKSAETRCSTSVSSGWSRTMAWMPASTCLRRD